MFCKHYLLHLIQNVGVYRDALPYFNAASPKISSKRSQNRIHNRISIMEYPSLYCITLQQNHTWFVNTIYYNLYTGSWSVVMHNRVFKNTETASGKILSKDYRIKYTTESQSGNMLCL